MRIDAIFRYCCFIKEKNDQNDYDDGRIKTTTSSKNEAGLTDIKVQKVQFDEESYLAGPFVMLQVEGVLDKSKNEALCVRSNQPSVIYVSSDGARLVIAHETTNCTAKVVEEMTFDVEDGNEPDSDYEQNANARKTRKMSMVLGDAIPNGTAV